MDIYEHFDFDINHLDVGNKIYSPATDTWSEATESLWTSLVFLKESHQFIVYFSENNHNGTDIETAEMIMELLDDYAALKREMQPFANEFCFRYKGYSLN